MDTDQKATRAPRTLALNLPEFKGIEPGVLKNLVMEAGEQFLAKIALGFTYKTPSWEMMVNDDERYFASKTLRYLAYEDVSRAIDYLLDFDMLMRSLWSCRSSGSMDRLLYDIEIEVLRSNHPRRSAIVFIYSVLDFAKLALLKDPRELAGQILGRVTIPPFDAEQSLWVEKARDWIRRAASSGLKIAVPSSFGRSGLYEIGAALRGVLEHDHPVTAIAISRDARYLAATNDKITNMWNAEKGGGLCAFHGQTGKITSVAISPDSKWIVTGSEDKTACIWNFERKKARVVLRGHLQTVTSVDINSRYVVTGSMDHTARVWDSRTGKQLTTFTHEYAVMSVTIRGPLLIAGSGTTVNIWDITKGNKFGLVLCGHTDIVCAVAACDGIIVSGSHDMTARIWDVKSSTVSTKLCGHTGPVTAVAISHDAQIIVTGSLDKTARTWDARSGELIQIFRGHSASVYAVAISPDSQRIFTGGDDNCVRIWGNHRDNQPRTLPNHGSRVTSMGISRKAGIITTASDDPIVRFWDISTGMPVGTLQLQSECDVVIYSEDGKYLVTATHGEEFDPIIWEVPSGKLVRTLKGHTFWVKSIDITRDSKLVAAGSIDGTARIWDAESGELLIVLDTCSFSACCVFFSYDDKFIQVRNAKTLTFEVSTGNPADNSLYIPCISSLVKSDSEHVGFHLDGADVDCISVDDTFAGIMDNTYISWTFGDSECRG